MFLVDDNLEARETRIRSFLTATDAPIAVLLAAAHFEWTTRRAILALGASPNKTIRLRFKHDHGLETYKEIWRDEVMPFRSVPGLAMVIRNWAVFMKAFKLRHVLIHGRGSCGLEYARPCVEEMLKAARAVIAVCESLECNLFERLKVRRKQRLPN